MDGLVSELGELEVAEIPPEIVDALLGEDGLHEGMPVTDQYVWQDLDHDHSHVSPQCHRHLQSTAIDQFLLVRWRKIRQNLLCISAIRVECLRLLSVRLRGILQRVGHRTALPPRRLRLYHVDLRLHVTPPVQEVLEYVREPRPVKLLTNIGLLLRTHCFVLILRSYIL